MSEWIKFTFSTNDDFKSWLQLSMDGVNHSWADDSGEAQHQLLHIGNDRPTVDLWCEVEDHTAVATAGHVVQIDVTEWQGDASPSITLESITLGDEVHTSATGSLNSDVSKYNVLTPEFQGFIDAGDVAPGTTVTEDLGYGSQTFYKTGWEGLTVIAKGSWQLAFSCPYLDWYTTAHQD